MLKTDNAEEDGQLLKVRREFDVGLAQDLRDEIQSTGKIYEYEFPLSNMMIIAAVT